MAQLLSDRCQKRFWSKVQIKGADECWLWQGGRITSRYGTFAVCHLGVWTTIRANRLAWISKNKSDVPKGMGILHSCISTPKCCNPAHLRPGTQQQNVDDMMQQGRKVTPFGEWSGRAKLTEAQVVEIRNKYSSGTFTQQALADMFSVNDRNISAIVRRKSWRHL